MNARPLHRGMVVVVHFENDRVKSENTYYTSQRRFEGGLPPNAFDGVAGARRIDP